MSKTLINQSTRTAATANRGDETCEADDRPAEADLVASPAPTAAMANEHEADGDAAAAADAEEAPNSDASQADYQSESGYRIDRSKRIVQPLDQVPRSSESAASEAQWKHNRAAKNWRLMTERLRKLHDTAAARAMKAEKRKAKAPTQKTGQTRAAPTGPLRILRRPDGDPTRTAPTALGRPEPTDDSPRPSSLAALPLSPARNRAAPKPRGQGLRASRATLEDLRRATPEAEKLLALLSPRKPSAHAAAHGLPK